MKLNWRIGRVWVREFDLGTQVSVACDISGDNARPVLQMQIAAVQPPFQRQQKREAARMALKALREGLRHARQ